MTNLDSILKKKRYHFADKGPFSPSDGFSNSHAQLLYEAWAPKNWCFRIVVLEKTLESLLDCKEIKPVYPKGNQPWIFTASTDAEAPILWPPDRKSLLTGKDCYAVKDLGQEEKGVKEDEIV